jgi:hypothetical protein
MATAALFLLSAVAHHVAAAGIAAQASMDMQAASAAGMASHDDATHCPPSSDCPRDMGMPMACFAQCATVLGILSEPVLIPMSVIGHRLTLPVANPLGSLHGPPDPHPPKPLVLI